MFKRISVLRTLTALFLIAAMFSSTAFAAHRSGRSRGGHHERYYYRGQHWYSSPWAWFEIGAATLTLGAIAANLPRERTVVLVSGSPYYYSNNMYFRPCPEGYVVVPAPLVVQPAAPVATMTSVQPVVVSSQPAQPVHPTGQQESFTVNVPNLKGAYTAVTLTRSGTGYIGPQGEFYQEFPSVEHLKAVYCK